MNLSNETAEIIIRKSNEFKPALMSAYKNSHR